MGIQIAIVTGSSSGFGFLTSLELARRGFQVIATMRNLQKGEILTKKAKELGIERNIEIHELDVTSEASIQSLKRLLESLGRLDVLVNNAGYAGAGFVEEIPVAEYRQQFETNLFGLIAVTQAVLPLMREQGNGNIINISSISGRIGFPGMSPYVASKYALEGWSECLRLEMKPLGINVALVEPGSYQTNIWSTGKQVTERSLQVDSPYFEWMGKLEDHLLKSEPQYGNPQEVANKVADLSQLNDMTLRHPVGKGVKLSIRLKNSLPWRSWEKAVLKRLN
ncbi:oxidoreductase [Bacillus sp. CECT 9360]|uniref:oxidoreductase n=1 Tax=Bacillus sp. CECT 9360 TaxID=2845821 RepID=UPI001E5C4884|nr:oxidoreductase [Bacillus sp. CECT 9360]CAH0343825.1 Putative ketoacyl reductase [Bacillus sp. CECT 9360]